MPNALAVDATRLNILAIEYLEGSLSRTIVSVGIRFSMLSAFWFGRLLALALDFIDPLPRTAVAGMFFLLCVPRTTGDFCGELRLIGALQWWVSVDAGFE